MTEEAGLGVKLKTCIQEVFGSNLGQDTGYSDGDLSLLSSVPPDKCRDSTSSRPRPFPSKSLPNYISLIALIQRSMILQLTES
jgi:hypothetical protein